jgi:hypothetical protein
MTGERRVAYVLSALELETVHRDVLRALLPKGVTKKTRNERGKRVSRNVYSTRFAEILQRYEQQGWIEREERVVRVVDADGLRHHYLDGDTRPETIDWEACLAVALRGLEKEKSESRDLEVQMIRQQMDLWAPEEEGEQ